MTRRRYEAYRDSGVELIGEIPAHWDFVPLARTLREPLKYGANEAADGDDPKLPRFVRITDIDDSGRLKSDTFKSLPEEIARPYLLQSGDVLFARSGSVGRSFLYDESWGPCAYAGYLIRARLDTRQARPDFLSYFTKSQTYLSWIRTVAIQATIENVSAEKYARMPFPLPPIEEQRAIAAFLDRETAKVDALIEKKRLLIERLEEQRTALISRTVTRGLPPEAARAAGLEPSARLKPSGVDWLGEVPEHWEVERFGREVQIQEGQVDPEVEPYASMLMVAPNHIESRSGRLLYRESAQEQAAISGKYYCRRGDVIYSKIRPALAKVTLAPEDCLCSADMYPKRGRRKVLNAYLFWLLLSPEFLSWSVLESDRVAMPKINRETLSELRMPVPPLPEQQAIAEYLNVVTAGRENVVSSVQAAIERLQEYRTALITAAVTGKIDVRESALEEVAAG